MKSPTLRRALERLSYIPQVFRVVFVAAKKWSSLWFVMLVVAGILPAATIYLTKILIDRLDAAMDTGLAWPDVQWALIPAAAMAGVLVLQQVVKGVIAWVRTAQSEKIEDHVKALVHEKAAALDLAFYDSPSYYDDLARANSSSSGRIMSILQNFGSMTQDLVTMLSLAGMLAMYGIWVPFLLLASAMPVLLVVVRNNLQYHDWWMETTDQRRWTSYYDRVLTNRSAAPEIRSFQLAEMFRGLYVKLRSQLRDARVSLMRNQMVANIGAGLSSLLFMAGAMGWMLWRAVNGMASLGDLALFYQAFSRGQTLMQSFLNGVGTVYSDTLFLEHLFRFLSLEPSVSSPAHPAPTPLVRRGIAFENVGFRYPGSDALVLDGFNLEIPAGKTAAIVGPNGAGKSTLINLICRFYDPAFGRVTIDGVDLKEIDIEELRRLTTVMFQSPVRWVATAEENITFGNVMASHDRRAVESAAAASGAGSIIDSLPHGYETLLSKQFEKGTELSGGEWQRISLARAFYREAPIVILDEPTSAMDSWEEAKWLRRFRKLVANKTAVIVTHRFTTAMKADVIYVMEDGRISESGSHEELLVLGGKYAASWYEQTESAGNYSAEAQQPSRAVAP